jgi:hypothetical protein
MVVTADVGLEPGGPLATGATGAVRAVSGVVRDGRILIELSAEEALAGPVRADLLANGSIVGSVTLEPSTVSPVTAVLSVPLPEMPELLDSIDVVLDADGVRSSAGRGEGFLLHRTLVRTVDEFEANVMRKHIRVRDRETVCYAARQALRRFPDDLRTCAVSLAVIGYRIAENPDGANEALLAELTDAADRLIAGIDGTRPSEARWSSSLNVMMFNVFATLRQPERACPYLLRLFADRRLVHVEPMCAFNCMIGLVALGYIYRLQRRAKEAVAVWSAAGEVFAISAYKMPKTFGALYEFEFIQQCATFCVASAAQVGGVRDKRMRAYTDLDVAALCLRASTRKGVNRTAQFFAAMKSRPDLLPAADAVVAYQYRQGEPQ